MSASSNVVPVTARHDAPEDWLTTERMSAYYVALSVNPALADADPLVRDAFIDKVIAGMRAAVKMDTAAEAKGRDQCIGLMRYDAAKRRDRLLLGGW